MTAKIVLLARLKTNTDKQRSVQHDHSQLHAQYIVQQHYALAKNELQGIEKDSPLYSQAQQMIVSAASLIEINE